MSKHNEHAEYKKGDHIVFIWGDSTVRKIELKPSLVGRILRLAVNIDGHRRSIMAQYCRHASISEIESGARIDK